MGGAPAMPGMGGAAGMATAGAMPQMGAHAGATPGAVIPGGTVAANPAHAGAAGAVTPGGAPDPAAMAAFAGAHAGAAGGAAHAGAGTTPLAAGNLATPPAGAHAGAAGAAGANPPLAGPGVAGNPAGAGAAAHAGAAGANPGLAGNPGAAGAIPGAGAVGGPAGAPGSGAGGGASQFQAGSAEDTLLKFCTAIAEGNLTAAGEHVSSKAKGELSKIREGDVSDARLEELQAAFELKGLQTRPSRNASGSGKTINLGNAKGQVLGFVLSKEDDVFKLKEFTLSKPKK